MSPLDTEAHAINSKPWWEHYAKNHWKKNLGRHQTLLFALYFAQAVPFPKTARTLLDVGCAMGDALHVIHQYYPHLTLKGCDFSAEMVEEARKAYSSIATFENWGIDDVKGHYDIIYCSNTLEHFEDYIGCAEKLLRHCQDLYVLVPYEELIDGKPITKEVGNQHVATFYTKSFHPLIERGSATKLRSWVRHAPCAWGGPPLTYWQRLKAKLQGVPLPPNYRQIFYHIRTARRLAA